MNKQPLPCSYRVKTIRIPGCTVFSHKEKPLPDDRQGLTFSCGYKLLSP